MQKIAVFTSIAAILALAGPACSAPTVYAAPTVQVYLIACQSDPSGCINEVGSVLMNRMTASHEANLCLPSPDYAQAVPKWLSAHPEDQNMAVGDGIYLTLKKLYSCN
jgi:hypothetical protein